MTIVKSFRIPCFVGNQHSTVDIFLGNPNPENNPVKFQADFLASTKGISIPQEILDTLWKLKNIAAENGVPFVELCEYALKTHMPDGVVAEVADTETASKEKTTESETVDYFDEASQSMELPAEFASTTKIETPLKTEVKSKKKGKIKKK